MIQNQNLQVAGHFTRLPADALTNWTDTLSASSEVPPPLTGCRVVRCKSSILANSDQAYCKCFILYDTGDDTLRLGEAFEILALADTGAICGILVGKAFVGKAPVPPYNYPSVKPLHRPSCYLQFEVSSHHINLQKSR